jgi:hypothetical protein
VISILSLGSVPPKELGALAEFLFLGLYFIPKMMARGEWGGGGVVKHLFPGISEKKVKKFFRTNTS